MLLDTHSLTAMESRQRAAFVNSLSGFKSANLVGTIDLCGTTNLAIMSSVVHLGSHPPLLALIIRPGDEDRHTLANILETGCFTVNHVNAEIIEAAHQTAARYPREVSEFAAAGLTPQWQAGFEAPMVAESAIKIGLRLREHQELAINRTHLLIGEVVLVDIPDASLATDGSLNVNACGTVALAGLDSYYQCRLIKRMAYAKPDMPPRIVAVEPGGRSVE